MKTRIFVGVWIAFCWQATGQADQNFTHAGGPEPAAMLAAAAPSNVITTATGAVYRNVQVEKAEPDGLTVSYTPSGGGIGIVKIKFDQLSDEWKQSYGFDPRKKLDYEKLELKAAAEWREQLIANYEAAVARRKAQEAAEAEAEAQALADKAKQAAEASEGAGMAAATNQLGTNQPVTSETVTNEPVTSETGTNVLQPPPP